MILPPTIFLKGGREIDAPKFETFEGVPVDPTLGSTLARVREVYFLFFADPGSRTLAAFTPQGIWTFLALELCTPKTMASAEPKASIETRSESVGGDRLASRRIYRLRAPYRRRWVSSTGLCSSVRMYDVFRTKGRFRSG